MTEPSAPAVSVVVPVYNGQATIEATLASVLRQTFVDYELIVIDDGSMDATRQLVEALTDPRVSLHSFPNKGLAASRNRGIRLARGRYVAFLDADDLWTPEKLARQVESLNADPSAALAYSLTDCIDERGDYIGPGSHIVDSGRVYEHLLIWNFLDNGSTPLIRRTVFDEVGVFDEALAAAEDWDLWLRIAHRHPIVCVPEPQVLYRIHGSAMSSKVDRQRRACLDVFDRAIARLPQGPQRARLDRQGRANLNRYFAGRLIATASSPRNAWPAFGYLWNWARLDVGRPSTWKAITIQTIKAMIVSVLPHRISRRVLASVQSTAQRWRPHAPGSVRR